LQPCPTHAACSGDLGEAAAADELERQGIRIVARQRADPRRRADLIGRDDHRHVVVEVKTRGHGSFVSAAEAVDGRAA
jgi:Holliday junction resolvase-like predicted endonuclease